MRARAWARRVDARLRGSGPVAVPPPADRLEQAVELVAELERTSVLLPGPATSRPFLVGDRFAARPVLPAPVSDMLPAPWRHSWGDEGPQTQQLAARDLSTAADAVVLGKYDSTALGLKLRVAYHDAGLVLGVLPAVVGRPHAGLRLATAHAVVGRHAPQSIPELVDLGELADGSRYVVERWVDGRPLLSQSRLEEALPEILTILGTIHHGYGVRRRRLSEVPGGLTPSSWAEVVGCGLVDQPTAAQVAALVERDATLRCSWTHGDPVASNVLDTGDRLVLVDWEMAGMAPVMHDSAKLHLYARSPDATLATILTSELAGGDLPRDAFTPAEELALAHARLLARYPARRARLVGHPRLAALETQSRTLAARLGDALAA